MTLVRHAKHFAAVAAAFAGLSLSVAYAAPNYEPPVLSPVDTTTLNSSSPLLNNFNGYLGAIEAQLTGGTLALPGDGIVSPASDLDFYAAVAAAVAADPVHAEQIVSAAVQYKPAKVKDIVKTVVLLTGSAAEAAVRGASVAAPKRAPLAAVGAISALIMNGDAVAQDFGDAGTAGVVLETRELIEKVAKAAVQSTKPLGKTSTAEQGAAAKDVAVSLVQAYLADDALPGSTAAFYADDLARGIIAGINKFEGTTRSEVAGLIMTTLVGAPGTEFSQAVNFAMGALRASSTDVSEYDDVRNALQAAAAGLTGDLAGLDGAILAGAKVQKALRTAPIGSNLQTVYMNNLGPAEAAEIGAYVTGAIQVLKSKGADVVAWTFAHPETVGLSVDEKQSVVAAAVTAKFGSAGKVVAAAINSGPTGLTATEAVSAAIPAATDLYSGAAVAAALKTIPATSAASASQVVLHAAITAAVDAGYESALGDVVKAAVKAKKIHDNDLALTAIANVPVGWEEAAAAVIIANNPKDKPAILGGPTNYDEILAAAAAKPGADVDGIQLAADIAKAGKASPKTLFDDAIERTYANSTKPRAILFGAGAVNSKLTAPLLGMLLRLKTGGDDGENLRDFAVSLDKKKAFNLVLAYEAAVDAVNYPDNLFDLVDHKVLTNPKQAPDILSAVVAARPEYAHYAARAAAFRSPATVGKSALAAIQFAHMRSNRDTSGADIAQADDPAAVAAISAAVVLGVQDAKLSPTKQTAAIKAAIAGLVKGSLSFQNVSGDPLHKKSGLISEADFEEATGNGTAFGDPLASTTSKAKGSAAVLTGAVAQLQVTDLESLSELAKVAITAATKAAKHHAMALAQAAGAAAAAAAAAGGTTFTDFASIASAMTLIPALSLQGAQFENAARFGADQFANLVYGAGAAGILNYQHVSGNNNPVSDIANF